MTIRNISLRDTFAGDGAFRRIADALSRLGRIVGNMRGVNGINVYQRGDCIIVDGSIASKQFTGKGWIRGKRFTTLNADQSKPYLQITVSTDPATVAEVAGPPPDPWGDNDVWRKKSDIVGDLYID